MMLQLKETEDVYEWCLAFSLVSEESSSSEDSSSEEEAKPAKKAAPAPAKKATPAKSKYTMWFMVITTELTN